VGWNPTLLGYGLFSAIQGPVTVNGTPSTQVTIYNDQDNLFPDTATITSGTVALSYLGIPLSAGVSYSGIGFLDVHGGSRNVPYDVESTGAATLLQVTETGTGADTVNFSPTAQDLDTIQGPVMVFPSYLGTNQYNFYDQMGGGPWNYALTPGQL